MSLTFEHVPHHLRGPARFPRAGIGTFSAAVIAGEHEVRGAPQIRVGRGRRAWFLLRGQAAPAKSRCRTRADAGSMRATPATTSGGDGTTSASPTTGICWPTAKSFGARASDFRGRALGVRARHVALLSGGAGQREQSNWFRRSRDREEFVMDQSNGKRAVRRQAAEQRDLRRRRFGGSPTTTAAWNSSRRAFRPCCPRRSRAARTADYFREIAFANQTGHLWMAAREWGALGADEGRTAV